MDRRAASLLASSISDEKPATPEREGGRVSESSEVGCGGSASYVCIYINIYQGGVRMGASGNQYHALPPNANVCNQALSLHFSLQVEGLL